MYPDGAFPVPRADDVPEAGKWMPKAAASTGEPPTEDTDATTTKATEAEAGTGAESFEARARQLATWQWLAQK